MVEINPAYAWVELLRSRPVITALVASSRITLRFREIEVPPQNTWLHVTPQVPFSSNPYRRWQGDVLLSAFAKYGHLSQQLIDTIIDDLYDPLTQFGMFRVPSVPNGSQEGAVITLTNPYGLRPVEMPISGDIYQDGWVVVFPSQVSEESRSWAS